MILSPVNTKRIKRFKSIKRGYYSLIILMFFVFLSLFAEFLMNSKAMLVSYNGHFYFPVFKFYSSTTFGMESETEPDYRDLKIKLQKEKTGFVIMPPITYDPYESDFVDGSPPPNAPSKKHWLGTDDRGRDILVRLFYGFRTAIWFALLLTILGYAVGISIGAVMGYYGGWVDLFFQRIIEIWSAIPFLYLCIIIASIFEPSFVMLLFVLLLFEWIGITYYIRTEIYREKSKDYCLAAKSIGAKNFRIIFKHLLPNCLVPVITFFPFAMIGAITALTSLDFLGYGLPAPTPSWGELMLQAREHLHKAYWIPLAAFSAVVITLLLITFIGEALREALDPKQFARYE